MFTVLYFILLCYSTHPYAEAGIKRTTSAVHLHGGHSSSVSIINIHCDD